MNVITLDYADIALASLLVLVHAGLSLILQLGLGRLRRLGHLQLGLIVHLNQALHPQHAAEVQQLS